MKKGFRILLVVIFAVITCVQMRAQNYVIDNLFGDAENVYTIAHDENDTVEYPGELAFQLYPGDTVTVTRLLRGNSYRAIRVKGDNHEYTINCHLLFCENNPAGTVDKWGSEKWNKGLHIRKFFATFTPYGIISILFILAMAFLFLGLKINSFRKSALYIIPACMLIASILEIWAYYVMGNDVFWWCSKSRYGFFGALFRAIPFVVFVAFQLYSIKGYERLLLGKDSDKKLSIKPMAISLAICLPLTAVVIIVMTLLESKGMLRDILSITTFLLSLGIGIAMSFKKNINLLGRTAGISFTLFGTIYIIASIISAIGLLIVFVQIVLQILLICAAIVIGFILLASSFGDNNGKGGSNRGAAWRNEDGTWSNGNGQTYNSLDSARRGIPR